MCELINSHIKTQNMATVDGFLECKEHTPCSALMSDFSWCIMCSLTPDSSLSGLDARAQMVSGYI